MSVNKYYDNAPDFSVDRIIESLTQINFSLESLRITMMTHSELATDHEERLRTIERWKHTLTPILALMTFVLGAVFTVALDRYFK